MSHAGSCQVHARHLPHVADVEVHHVWPRGQGGPDVPKNRVPICGTGHSNVHTLLRLAEKAGGVDAVVWELRRPFTPGERRLARIGYGAAHDLPGFRELVGA